MTIGDVLAFKANRPARRAEWAALAESRRADMMEVAAWIREGAELDGYNEDRLSDLRHTVILATQQSKAEWPW